MDPPRPGPPGMPCRDGQSFFQVFGRDGQVALRLAAERQVVKRDEDSDPVARTAAYRQAIGEQPSRRVVIALAERTWPRKLSAKVTVSSC